MSFRLAWAIKRKSWLRIGRWLSGDKVLALQAGGPAQGVMGRSGGG